MANLLDKFANQLKNKFKSISGEVYEELNFNRNNIGKEGAWLSETLHGTDFDKGQFGPYATGILGMPKQELEALHAEKSPLLQELKAELETKDAWLDAVRENSIKENGYHRIISVYGQDLKNENIAARKPELVVASEIYNIGSNVDALIKDLKLEQSHSHLQGKEQFIYFVNYAYTIDNEEFKDKKLPAGSVKNVELAISKQIVESMRLAESAGGQIVGAFFECESKEKFKEKFDEDLSAKSQARPVLFTRLAKGLGKAIETLGSYIQPYLDGNHEERNYCTHLNGYFMPSMGVDKLSPLQQLAFVDRFFEEFTGKRVHEHTDKPEIKAMYDDLVQGIKNEKGRSGQVNPEQLTKDLTTMINKGLIVVDKHKSPPPTTLPSGTNVAISGPGLETQRNVGA
jgi:hypothetical protein